MGSRNRAVVSGLGPVAACGTGLAAYWTSVQNATSGIGPITLFDATGFGTNAAGEVKNFDLLQHFHPVTPVKRLSRQTQLALAAAKMALDDAGLYPLPAPLQGQIPVNLGISTSSYSMIEIAVGQLMERGPSRVPPHISSASQPQQAASVMAEEFSLGAHAQTFSSACPAGMDAIWAAAELVRSGRSDYALAGGADAPVCALGMACLMQSGLVSRKDLEPHKSSRPFNRDNDTGIIAEGAGMVVVENLDCARARGARPYLEIVGYASCIDPHLQDLGSGLAITMQRALDEAGLLPTDIDYICAHGSGHPALDRAEDRYIKKVFGSHAYRIPVSSVKGVIGNPLAAAAPLQVIAAACALRDQVVPPTANLDDPDPECDLDHVPGQARRYRCRTILINAHGLGGGNSTLIVRELNPA